MFGLANPVATGSNVIELIFSAYVGNKVSVFACSFKDSSGIGAIQPRVSGNNLLTHTFSQVSSGSVLYSTVISNTTIGTINVNGENVALEFGQHNTNKKNIGGLYSTTHSGNAIDIPIVSTVSDSFFNNTVEILGV